MAAKRQVYKIFIGGGGDHWISGIVSSYETEYARLNPDVHTKYFSWTQSASLATYMYLIPTAANVTIVGHSYGGDSAFSLLRWSRTVNVLISIDPVGRIQVPWSIARAGATRWLNVLAEPTEARRTSDDTIAWLGGKYGRPPAPGQANAPDYSYTVDATHGAFRTMMRYAPSGGTSGRVLLGGNFVA